MLSNTYDAQARGSYRVDDPSSQAGLLTSVIEQSTERSLQTRQRKAAVCTRGSYTRHPLTTEEVTNVEVATIRESTNHRRWPKEVIEKFLASDSISLCTCAEDQLVRQEFLWRCLALMSSSIQPLQRIRPGLLSRKTPPSA